MPESNESGAGLAIGHLGRWLDEASDGHHLPDPRREIAQVEETNEANSAIYIRALRSRLISLGYLDEDHARGDRFTPKLGAAVKTFQREAGFTGGDIDGWAGPQTKRRLQQLVSFEEEQNLEYWGELGRHPADYPAVGRAAYLRLYTLGFVDWEARLSPRLDYRLDHNPSVKQALARFLECVWELGLTDRVLDSQVTPETLQLLFGQDALVRALAEHPEFLGKPTNSGFVEAIGRVELWLFGYDVAIAGPQKELLKQVFEHGPRNPPSYKRVDPVDIALGDFMHRFPGTHDTASKTRFSVAFFEQVSRMTEDTDETTQLALQDAVLRKAAEHGASVIDKLGQLASRVWDGAKRLWAWLKNTIRTLWGQVEDDLWNLARFIARGARESYEVVLKAIDILHRGSVYLRQRTFPGSDPLRAAIGFGADMDSRLFVNADAGNAPALDLVREESHDARFFIVACRILQTLMTSLAEVVRVVMAGALGWFVLILGLSRVARDIMALRDTIVGLDQYDLGTSSLYPNPVM